MQLVLQLRLVRKQIHGMTNPVLPRLVVNSPIHPFKLFLMRSFVNIKSVSTVSFLCIVSLTRKATCSHRVPMWNNCYTASDVIDAWRNDSARSERVKWEKFPQLPEPIRWQDSINSTFASDVIIHAIFSWHAPVITKFNRSCFFNISFSFSRLQKASRGFREWFDFKRDCGKSTSEGDQCM